MQPMKIPNKTIMFTAEDVFTLFAALFVLDQSHQAGHDGVHDETIHATVNFLGGMLKKHGINPVTGEVSRGPSTLQ